MHGFICSFRFKAIGRKHVLRVLGEMGLKLRRKAIKKQTTDSRHCFPRHENLVKGFDVVGPDQVWVGDDVYCTKRIHSSLGYLTPAEFAAQWAERLL